jgi:hypothetical protein
LRRLELDVFAIPAPAQREVMISYDAGESFVILSTMGKELTY